MYSLLSWDKSHRSYISSYTKFLKFNIVCMPKAWYDKETGKSSTIKYNIFSICKCMSTAALEPSRPDLIFAPALMRTLGFERPLVRGSMESESAKVMEDSQIKTCVTLSHNRVDWFIYDERRAKQSSKRETITNHDKLQVIRVEKMQ